MSSATKYMIFSESWCKNILSIKPNLIRSEFQYIKFSILFFMLLDSKANNCVIPV